MNPVSSNNPRDDIMVLAPGQILFQQGDPGGDLYFIQQGKIEIYTVKDGLEVILTVMDVNEVIGMMTFASNTPRMAFARAKTEAVLKRVTQKQITGQISSLPAWLKIVLKDFKLRINHMNEKYSSSQELIRELKKTQLSYIYLCRQMCGVIAATSPKMCITVDNKRFVVADEMKDFLEQALLISTELVAKLFDVFVDSGMLKIEIEPDRKRKVFSVKSSEKLLTFAQFIADARRGQNKKIIDTEFTNKEIRTLTGIISFAKRMEMDLKSECSLNISDLSNSLEKMTGTKFEIDALDASIKLKLVNHKINADKITFIPTQLSRTLTNIKNYKKIEKFEEQDRQNRKKGNTSQPKAS